MADDRPDTPYDAGRRRASAALLMLPLGALSPVMAATPIRLLLQELPPYVINRRGVSEGLAVEILQDMMRQRGLNLPLTLTPLPRAIELLSGPGVVLFGPLARTEAYESRFRWIGPIVSNPAMVLRRRSDEPMPASLDAVRSAGSIAVGRASSHEAAMQKLGFRNLLQTRDIVDSLRKLVKGEVDYAIAGSLTIHSGLDELGIAHELIERTGIVVARLPICFALSRALADSEFEAWHAAFEQLRRSGRLAQLRKKHFGSAAEEGGL